MELLSVIVVIGVGYFLFKSVTKALARIDSRNSAYAKERKAEKKTEEAEEKREKEERDFESRELFLRAAKPSVKIDDEVRVDFDFLEMTVSMHHSDSLDASTGWRTFKLFNDVGWEWQLLEEARSFDLKSDTTVYFVRNSVIQTAVVKKAFGSKSSVYNSDSKIESLASEIQRHKVSTGGILDHLDQFWVKFSREKENLSA